jgi:3-oxoacyl-[acyl-carrier protein] reductase
MDLGIAGREAIICGSSRGLGRACAEALAAEGVNVVINGRGEDSVHETVAAIRNMSSVRVTPVVADATTDEGIAALLAACPEPDIIVTNSIGPLPKFFAEIEEDAWVKTVQQNMIAPILLVRAVLPSMRRKRFGRIINITSAMVTAPRPHMALSASARAGLTAAMKALSLDVAKDNVTVNNLLPERFDTDRQHNMAKAQSAREGITYEEARAQQLLSVAARRLGNPKEFGAACAFYCSDLAGFMSGQNVHLDGGSYPGLI